MTFNEMIAAMQSGEQMGFTFDRKFQNYIGKRYVVSVKSRNLPLEKECRLDVMEFVWDNEETAECFGTYKFDNENLFSIDANVTMDDHDKAMAKAIECKQYSFWDSQENCEVLTGLTGKDI